MTATDDPWKTVSSRQVYRDSFIRLRVDRVIRPDGNLGMYSVVEFKGGVGIVALTEENEVYLVGQYRYPAKVYSWEIPKGAFAAFGSDEKPLDTARRELEEETGLIAEEWTELGRVFTLMGSTDDKVYLFLARRSKNGAPRPERGEQISIRRVPLGEIFALIDNHEIIDATSITALYFTEKYLIRGTH